MGGGNNPLYRSRLVAQQIMHSSKERNIFVATPPLEAHALLFSTAVTEGIEFERGERERGLKLALIGVSSAYYYNKAKGNIFVTLPEGDYEPARCGKPFKLSWRRAQPYA
eukprot:7115668-Pyramimonas_sp.AAC.1